MPAPSFPQSADSRPSFFQSADLLDYQRRLQSNPHYNKTADQKFVAQFKEGIFAKTAYWCEQVGSQLQQGRYEYVMRQIWAQGTHFRKYSWGRFFLRGKYPGELDKTFYFTFGVDSGLTEDAQNFGTADPALILKLDGHSASDSKLSEAQYIAGEVERQKLGEKVRWLRIGPEQLEEYTWPRLFKETIAFIEQHEADLRRIMAAAGR